MINHLRDWIFKNVHSSNLVYNICWEDPRCDRQVMNINEESKIVMITSAGCNALDYLLDNPAQIHCIDLNSRQNALVELKKALFKATTMLIKMVTFAVVLTVALFKDDTI